MLGTGTRRDPKNCAASPAGGFHEQEAGVHWPAAVQSGGGRARPPMRAPRSELKVPEMSRRRVPGRKRGSRPGAQPGTETMGAATARAREAKLAEEEALPPDWARLPNEVLALILSWLPPETLATRCRLVCRRWRDLVDGPAAWQLQWRREPSMRAALEAARRCPRLRWSRLGVLRPLGRNLIRNPCGTEQFRHWAVQCEFPEWNDGWSVVNNCRPLEGAEAQTCFASSFRWCQKEQVIDLLKEGFWQDLLDTYQPDIVVTDWWGGRQDCGCEYQLSVALLAANKRKKIDLLEVKPEPIPQWNDASYQKVTHTFRRYGCGVRYIHFRHRGKDTQFWAGHYGARVTNSSVIIQFSSESPESLKPVLSSASS